MTQGFCEAHTMRTGCPAKCGHGIQKPVGVEEFSLLSNKTRTEILLLEETAWLCENCGAVYVTSDGESVLLDLMPSNGGAGAVRPRVAR